MLDLSELPTYNLIRSIKYIVRRARFYTEFKRFRSSLGNARMTWRQDVLDVQPGSNKRENCWFSTIGRGELSLNSTEKKNLFPIVFSEGDRRKSPVASRQTNKTYFQPLRVCIIRTLPAHVCTPRRAVRRLVSVSVDRYICYDEPDTHQRDGLK